MYYTQQQLDEGTRIELQNSQDSALARKLAARNLREDAAYYDKLKSAGVDECGDCGCGDPANPHVDAIEIVAADTQHVADHQPSSSSGLGKGGVNKPLTSDKLDTNMPNKVGPNKVASTKTPPLAGSTIHTGTDPLDHFASAIMGLAEGDAQIKKK